LEASWANFAVPETLNENKSICKNESEIKD